MPPGASLEGVPCLVRGRPQTFVAQFRRLVRDRPVVAFLQIEAHVDTKADLHRGKVTSVFMGSDPLATFNPATRAWFEATFRTPTRAQELAWPAIARARALPARARGHPHHHARVALPDPHKSGAGCASQRRKCDRRRDPRGRSIKARIPPRAHARAARGTARPGREEAAAGRPFR